MSQINHQDWLSRNALRDFPIQEGAPVVSRTGFTLPEDLIVDVLLSTSAPGAVYLSAVCLGPRLVTLVFSAVDSGSTLATVTATKGQSRPFVRYPLDSADGNSGGFVAFGSFLDRWFFGLQPDRYGTNTFESQTRLESRCVISVSAFPVTSVRANLKTEVITGGVEFSPQGALDLVVTEGTDADNEPLTYLTFSIADEAPFVPLCDPPGDQLLCSQTPILSINGVTPDENGNLEVEFVGFTSVLQVEHILKATLLLTGTAFCRGLSSPSG